MFSFANPEYLYLLLLLPVVAILYRLAQNAKAKKIAKFGRAQVVKQLMPEQSRYKPWIRLGVELAIVATIVVMLARPRGAAQQTNTTLKGIEVMICLDVSNSMNSACANDMPEVSRLQRSKQVLEKLINRLTGNKVGLIVFAGNAYMQMPLTGDAQSAKMYLNNISTDIAPTQGTAIGAAINMACQCFSQNPHTVKNIIVITDGENFEDDATSAANEAQKNGIAVNVVGIGSVNGAPVVDANGQVLTDESGNPAIEQSPCPFREYRNRLPHRKDAFCHSAPNCRPGGRNTSCCRKGRSLPPQCFRLSRRPGISPYFASIEKQAPVQVQSFPPGM